jgi:hypothetical protein
VFLDGDDCISSDLHNAIVQTNQTMSNAADARLRDERPGGSGRRLHAQRSLQFPKMARIGELMYESGFAIAATEKVLERDDKGPRVGFGSQAEMIKKH